MASEWWNETQMMEWHSNDGMTSEWWNDIRMYGMIILWIVYWEGMREWWWNDAHFRTQGFALLQKYLSFHPHSVIPTSFLNDRNAWNEVKMKRMTLKWYPSIVICIPCHSKHSKMMKEWRNVWEWRWFWKWTTNLILRYISFCHHSIIPTSFHFGKSLEEMRLEWAGMRENGVGMDYPLYCQNDIQMMEWHLNDRMTFKWKNDTQMIILAQRDIITLDPPFVPTVCQQMEWHPNERIVIWKMEWHLNDRLMSEWVWNELFWHKGILIP